MSPDLLVWPAVAQEPVKTCWHRWTTFSPKARERDTVLVWDGPWFVCRLCGGLGYPAGPSRLERLRRLWRRDV